MNRGVSGLGAHNHDNDYATEHSQNIHSNGTLFAAGIHNPALEPQQGLNF